MSFELTGVFLFIPTQLCCFQQDRAVLQGRKSAGEFSAFVFVCQESLSVFYQPGIVLKVILKWTDSNKNAQKRKGSLVVSSM